MIRSNPSLAYLKLKPKITYGGFASLKHFKASYLTFSRAKVICFPYCFNLYIGSACLYGVITISGFSFGNSDGLNSIYQVPFYLVYLDTYGKCPSNRNSVAKIYVFTHDSVSWWTCIIRVHLSWIIGLPRLLPILSIDRFRGSGYPYKSLPFPSR